MILSSDCLLFLLSVRVIFGNVLEKVIKLFVSKLVVIPKYLS